MPTGQAVELLWGIADGLDAAHAVGLRHGAISPATIWIERASDHDMRAHLAGFGLEALLRAQARGDHRDSLIDDVVYIAPEQLRSDDGDSDRADQYALACALYHCVTGAPPFVRDRTSALFGAHMLARPTPPMSGDSAFDDAVVTGMAKDPEQRFDSCTALLAAASGHPIARAARGEGERRGPQGEGEPQRAGGRGPQGEGEPQRAGGWGSERADHAPAASVSDVSHDQDTEPAAEVATPVSIPVTRGHHAAAAPDGSADEPVRRRPGSTWVVWLAVGLFALIIVAGAAALITGMVTRQVEDRQDAARQAVSDTVAGESEAGATVAWQREIGQEPVTHLGVEDLNAVAATGNNLTVVNPLTGSRRWRKVADVGILTDLITSGDVAVYRTDVLSGVSLPYGIQLWESNDVPTAPGGLSTGASNVYAIGPGDVLPELVAVDPQSGEERWHFHGRQVRVDIDAAVDAGDDVVVILQRRVIFGIDPRRKPAVTEGGGHVEIDAEEWRIQVGNPWIETLATSGTKALFALQNGSVCTHALMDGSKQWCTQVSGVRDGAPGLLVHNETVVVVSRDEIVALDLSTGQERWMVEAAVPLLPLVAVDSGMVYTADTDGAVHTYALSDGRPQWDAGGLGDITALAGADGGVIVGTEDGVLARIEPRGSAR